MCAYRYNQCNKWTSRMIDLLSQMTMAGFVVTILPYILILLTKYETPNMKPILFCTYTASLLIALFIYIN